MAYWKLLPDLYKVAALFHEHGYQCYLVGGAVRDKLLGKAITDYDLATDAQPGEVKRIFRRVIPTGIKHGTVTVLFGRERFEVTTFRVEGKYEDGRRPSSVSFTPSLEADLGRRDFTINAMAYDLVGKKLRDPFAGQEDLKAGIIRAIGRPVERFQEDALRLLRACRFAAQLGFRLEAATREAMCETSAKLRLISAERVRDELSKTIMAPDPVLGFELMRETGLLKLILPELEACLGLEQRDRHRFDVYYHSLYSCEGARDGSEEVRTAALLHDIGKAVTRGENEAGEPTFYQHQQASAKLAGKILKRLRYPGAFIKRICHLITHHMFNYTEEWSDGAVRRFLARVGPQHFPALCDLRLADQYGQTRSHRDSPRLQAFILRVQQITAEDTALSLKDLRLNGKEIMHHLGLPAGKTVGTILHFLLEAVIEDPGLNEKKQLLTLAEKFYRQRLKIDGC